jgi:hypothetical protein
MTTLNVTSGQYVSFAHRLLWDSPLRHLVIAAERPDDSWMLHLSAGLLAAAAFEAYLNYLGGEILPNIWAKERSFFSTSPYRGTVGKLKCIADELKWDLPPKSREPLSGVVELLSLRDKIVHAKPKKEAYRRVHKDTDFAPVPATWLYREAPEKRVRALIKQVEAFAVSLHNTVLRSGYRNAVFGAHPFLGALGFGTHTVESLRANPGVHTDAQDAGARR